MGDKTKGRKGKVEKRAGRRPRKTLRAALKYVNELARPGHDLATFDHLDRLVERHVLPRVPGGGWRRVYLDDLVELREAVAKGKWKSYYERRLKESPIRKSPGPLPGPKIKATLVSRWYPRHFIVPTARAEDVVKFDEGVRGRPIAVIVPDSGDAVGAVHGGPGFGARHLVIPHDDEEDHEWLALCWRDEFKQEYDQPRVWDAKKRKNVYVQGPWKFPEDFDHLFALGYLKAEVVELRPNHPLYETVKGFHESLGKRRP
ncbi:MAG: hypothetical protein WD716_11375 [Fimbriimonadaceae bacterium]